MGAAPASAPSDPVSVPATPHTRLGALPQAPRMAGSRPTVSSCQTAGDYPGGPHPEWTNLYEGRQSGHKMETPPPRLDATRARLWLPPQNHLPVVILDPVCTPSQPFWCHVSSWPHAGTPGLHVLADPVLESSVPSVWSVVLSLHTPPQCIAIDRIPSFSIKEMVAP